MATELYFNIDNGYLEGLCRGFRGGILTKGDYLNLIQCETVDDLKVQLQGTDYAGLLQNEPSPLAVSVIDEKLKEKLVTEFQHLRSHAYKPLSTFLDFITYSYMIDNIVLLLTGSLHQRQVSELRNRCHPLGSFEEMGSINIANTPAELHSAVMVDTPLAPYFEKCISEQDLDEVHIEIIRNTLYKAYLEDFHRYCKELGEITAEVMCPLLEFEADRRAFIITINSFGTALNRDDRVKLYPTIGKLHPDGLVKLSKASDYEEVRQVADAYKDYQSIFAEAGTNPGEKTLEDRFYEREVHLNKLSFMQQCHFGVFYSFVKLKEQEIRNVVWIAECIAQRHRTKIDNYIPIFD